MTFLLKGGLSYPLSIENPLPVSIDEVTIGDVDWDNSDFTGWVGDPQSILGNVNNGGIYNDSTDNPKAFTLRLKRTRQSRVFGLGSNEGFHSNFKATILGSGDVERGVLDRSPDPTQRKSTTYKEEQFEFNAIMVEFFTADRIDISNLFLKNEQSDKKQNVVHKWGANPDVDAGQSEFIWPLGDEYIFTTTPQKYFISSDNAGDGIDIDVETVGINAQGRYQREKTTITLQGNTKVEIPTLFNCIACNRAFVGGDIPASGNVYIYEDGGVTGGVPDDLSLVKAIISLGRNQTRQAIYTVPEFLESGQQVQQFDFYNYSIDLSRQQSAAGEGVLVVKEIGGVERERHSLALSDSAISRKVFGENTPLIISPGSDIYLIVGDITANNTSVFGEFTGSLILL